MSCLYRALSYFHQQYNTDQMRAMLCRYLGSNPELSMGKASQVIPWETGQSLQQYLHRMSNRSSWGGAIEIKAYADLFNTNVKVYSMPNRRAIEFLTANNPENCKWVAISWTGGHYEPIRSQQEHQTMERAISTPPRANQRQRGVPPQARHNNRMNPRYRHRYRRH